jgi:hypothetical protein
LAQGDAANSQKRSNLYERLSARKGTANRQPHFYSSLIDRGCVFDTAVPHTEIPTDPIKSKANSQAAFCALLITYRKQSIPVPLTERTRSREQDSVEIGPQQAFNHYLHFPENAPCTRSTGGMKRNIMLRAAR